jgi:CRISPR-associated endonuclease Cas1
MLHFHSVFALLFQIIPLLSIGTRLRLLAIESRHARLYFGQIFKLFLENIRPKRRIGFKAYDGINNLFNLGYWVLSWKVHKALFNAKLEPYLGFLHSLQYGKPSMVCDLLEIYRFLIDDFLIQHYSKKNEKSLVTKYETLSKSKIGKRECLNDYDSKELMRQLNLLS